MKKVLVIGSTAADISIYVDHLPSVEEDVHPHAQRMSVGGCAYNTANVLAAMDIPYTLFSPLGTGIYADFIRKNCGRVKPCIETDEENGCCYCLIDDDGNRTFLSLHGAEYRFQKEWFAGINRDEYDFIYVCGLEIEEPTGEHIISFLKDNRQAKIIYATGPRIIHTDLSRNEEVMRLAHLIHLNRREACSFLAKTGVQEERADKASQIFFERYGVSSVITDGGNDVTVNENGRIYTVPVVPVKQVNGTGAGDGHIGMIIACLARGESLQNAIPKANAYSAKIVESKNSVLTE